MGGIQARFRPKFKLSNRERNDLSRSPSALYEAVPGEALETSTRLTAYGPKLLLIQTTAYSGCR